MEASKKLIKLRNALRVSRQPNGALILDSKTAQQVLAYIQEIEEEVIFLEDELNTQTIVPQDYGENVHILHPRN